MTNPRHIFAETALNSVRLQSNLETITPVSGTVHASVWLSAIAALAPHLTAAEVLGAWPLQNTSQGWWNLITNLGFEVADATHHTPSSDTRTCWCWLRPGGDIWLSHDGLHIWQSQARTVHTVTSLPRGEWTLLITHEKPETIPVTMADVLIGGIRPVLPTLLLSSMLVQGLGLLVPVFIMVVYDHVIDGRAPVGYGGLLIGMLTVLTLETLMRRVRGTLLVRAGIRAETLWVNRLVAQLIHLPAALVERAPLSSQLNRLRGVDIFRDMATSPVVLGMLDVPFIALVLLTMFIVAGELVLIPLMLIASYLTFMFICLPWVKSALRKQATVSDIQQSMVLEASQNQLALRADGLTDIWMERFESSSAQAMKVTSATTFLQHFLEVFSLIGSSVAGLLTLSTGVHMVQAGTLSAGGLVASMMLVWRMLAPLSLICTALPRLVQIFQTAQQLTSFLNIQTETPPLAPPAPMQLPQPAPRGDLTLSGLVLRYTRDHALVLNNLSATVEAGQLVCIMGANGSGKSTLLKIIMGVYPVQGGTLRLDGIDTRQWDPERLRSHIAYLPQHPDMFADTIAANLRLSDPLASDEQLWNAIEMADAAETVRQLNNGLEEKLYDVEVPELFYHQLNLARLYLHHGPIVLCDEIPATLTALPAGKNFQQWLLTQKGHRTVLVINACNTVRDASDFAIGLRTGDTAYVGPAPSVLKQLNTAAQTSLMSLANATKPLQDSSPSAPQNLFVIGDYSHAA